jgi:GNAT superfamily N-acetyltransferase
MVTVRTATPDDVPVIAGLRRAWTEENAGQPVDDPSFDDVFAEWFAGEAHQRVTWLAEDDGRVLGMLNLLVFTRMPRPRAAEAPAHPGQWGYVANVYVVPGDRDRGIGRLLLDAVTAHADKNHYARLVLSPSERSVPFYERAGFAPATSLLLRPGR